MIQHRFGLAVLLMLVSLAPRSGAELVLRQEAVIGFPVDWSQSLVAYELPGEGRHRLVLINRDYLLGLEWSPLRTAYEQSFFIQDIFDDVVLADADGDGIDELVAFENREDEVRVYDSATGSKLRSFSLEPRDRFVAALDLDGRDGSELLLLDFGGLTAYRGGVELWKRPDLRSGTIVEDGGARAGGEIFVLTGGSVVVLDSHTGAERRRLPGPCTRAAAGPVDADRNMEIACAANDTVTLMDAVSGAVQWTQSVWGVQDLLMLDADGDGVRDVVVRSGGTHEGSVVVLNGTSGRPMAAARSLWETGPLTALTVGCEPHLVVLEGGQTTRVDQLHVLDPRTLQSRWTQAIDEYSLAAIAVADADGDGRNELLAHHDGKMSVIGVHPTTVRAEHTHGVGCCSPYREMGTAQLDGDPALEYLLHGDGAGGVRTIRAFDGATHEPMWTATYDGSEAPRSLSVGDLDGDGTPDVVIATIGTDSGAMGRFVYAFDGATGQRMWRSLNIPGLAGIARIADSDADGQADVLALSGTIGLVRLEGETGSPLAFDEFPGGFLFQFVNADQDPELEAVVVAEPASGEPVLLLRDSGQTVRSLKLPPGGVVAALEVADVDGDGTVEVLTSRRDGLTGARLEVRSLDSFAPLWTSELLPEMLNFAQAHDIAVGDVDNDGRDEVLFMSSLTVRVFRVGAARDSAAPPRFAAGARLEAQVVAPGACCTSVRLRWAPATSDASPPLTYEVYRSEVLIGTTQRNELTDSQAGGPAHRRYTVRVLDRIGQAGDRTLAAEVSIPGSANCRRRAVRP